MTDSEEWEVRYLLRTTLASHASGLFAEPSKVGKITLLQTDVTAKLMKLTKTKK